MSCNRSYSGDSTLGTGRWCGASVPNYGFSNQTNQGTNAPNFGFSNGNSRGSNAPNYGFSNENNRGSSAPNFGFSNGNSRGSNAPNFGFSHGNNRGSSAPNFGFSHGNNRGSNASNYGFSNENNRGSSAPNFGFSHGNNRGSNASNYGFSNENNRGSSGPNFGFSNQNNQDNHQSYNQYSGFNQTSTSGSENNTQDWNNGRGNYSNTSNLRTGDNFINESYNNNYGMAGNLSSNCSNNSRSNNGTSVDPLPKELNAYNKPCNSDRPNSVKIHENAVGPSFVDALTPTNIYPGKKLKKDLTKPLPKGVKLNKAERKQLVQLAAKRKLVDQGVRLSELKDNTLIRLAAADINKVQKLRLSELPRRFLRQEVEKLLPHTNVRSISVNGLRTILRRDPDYKPPDGKNILPDSVNNISLRSMKRDPQYKHPDNLTILSKFLGNKGIRRVKKGHREADQVLQSLSAEKEDDHEMLPNPVKKIVTPGGAVNNALERTGKDKRKMYNPGHVQQRYDKLKANKSLDSNDLVVAGYLHYVMFQVIPKARPDCSLLSEYVMSHRNNLKLLRFQVKKLLDQKFVSDNSLKLWKKAKKKFLVFHKQEVLKEGSKYFPMKQEACRSELIDKCIDILMSDVYPAELIPTPSDYMRDPTVTPTHEKSTEEFQYLFIKYMYEALGFFSSDKLSDADMIKFHLDNAIIPTFLVEFVRSYDTYVSDAPFEKNQLTAFKPGDRLTLPPGLNTRFKKRPGIGYMRNVMLWKIYAKLREDNAQMQTKIFDVIPRGEKLETELLRDFANVIVFSDEILSVVKYKLMEHTPYIALMREEKLKIFDLLVQKTYRQAFQILQSKLSIHDIFKKRGLIEDIVEEVFIMENSNENKRSEDQ